MRPEFRGQVYGFYMACRSICLLLQVALPVLLFAKDSSRVVLRGGTNADMAPPIDYFLTVRLEGRMVELIFVDLFEGVSGHCREVWSTV